MTDIEATIAQLGRLEHRLHMIEDAVIWTANFVLMHGIETDEADEMRVASTRGLTIFAESVRSRRSAQ